LRQIGVGQHGEALVHPVEDQKLVRYHKIHRRRAVGIDGRLARFWVDVVDELIPEIADRSAGEPGQMRQPHCAVLPERFFHRFQRVADLARPPRSFRFYAKPLDLPAGLPRFHMGAELSNDGARIASYEGISADVLAAFDRLEEKRFAPAPDFDVGRKRRFKIRKKPARDRDQVGISRQFQEFFFRRALHGIGQGSGEMMSDRDLMRNTRRMPTKVNNGTMIA